MKKKFTRFSENETKKLKIVKKISFWPENGRIGANGLKCQICFNSELIFEIYDKNFPRKKNFMCLRPFWNFENSNLSGPYQWALEG